MGLHLPDVLRLAVSARAQVGTASMQGKIVRRVLRIFSSLVLRARGTRSCCICAGTLAAQFKQSQLNFFKAQTAAGACIELVERIGRKVDFFTLARNAEFFPAARNRHLKCRLDLAQIGIQGTAQCRKFAIVDRSQAEFQRRRFHACHAAIVSAVTISPRKVKCIAWVMATSTKLPINRRLPGKFTTRLLSVRPISSVSSLRETPSTSTRWVPPIMALEIAVACPSSTCCRRCRRLSLIS